MNFILVKIPNIIIMTRLVGYNPLGSLVFVTKGVFFFFFFFPFFLSFFFFSFFFFSFLGLKWGYPLLQTTIIIGLVFVILVLRSIN